MKFQIDCPSCKGGVLKTKDPKSTGAPAKRQRTPQQALGQTIPLSTQGLKWNQIWPD